MLLPCNSDVIPSAQEKINAIAHTVKDRAEEGSCVYVFDVFVCVGGVNQFSSARWRSRPDFFFSVIGKACLFQRTPPHLIFFTGVLQVGVVVSESLPAAS